MPSTPKVPAPVRSDMQRQEGYRKTAIVVLIWVLATLIAAFFALLARDSAHVNGEYVPLTNDSFYHARRILDAAVGERGFYQFDHRLQVPDGTWIPWAWGYDFLVAKITQIWLWIWPQTDPMAPISSVSVALIPVNAALFLAAAGAFGLSVSMRAVALLAFALSPFTQLLHSIGMIDHHVVEHTFVLLNVYLGARWFKDSGDATKAALLGGALGLAHAVHNGLFLLQMAPLGCIFLLWTRRGEPPKKSLYAFCIALLAVTFMAAAPSQALHAGMFEFALLSWFHVYVALCTSISISFMAWRPFSGRQLAGLIAIAILLSIPILAEAGRGAAFVAAKISVLNEIIEARSVYRLIADTYGLMGTMGYYSWLLVLSPLLLGYYGVRIVKERDPCQLFYAIIVVFGLTLLLAQMRFHYHGLFALVTSGLMLIDKYTQPLEKHRGAVFVGVLALVALAYQPPLHDRLFRIYPPGADPEYAYTRVIYHDLARLCQEDPGTVLANHDDGNFVLFHSQCSVIANNFILRAEDERKIDEIDRLMKSSPQLLRTYEPALKYLLIRARDFSLVVDGTARLVTSNEFARQFLVAESGPPGFDLIRTIRNESNGEIYARLFKISPTAHSQ